jgi:signal peptidase I
MDTPRKTEPSRPVRGFIAEWVVVVLIYLFGTTALLQAFIVPTGSMTSTLMIGDHLFVDKLTYSPPSPISAKVLPFTEPRRGDIVCFDSIREQAAHSERTACE